MFNKVQKFFSIIFLVATIGGFIVNLVTQRTVFLSVLDGISLPKSPAQAGEVVKTLNYTFDSYVFSKPSFIESYAYIQMLMGKYEIYKFDHMRNYNGAVKISNFYSTDPEDLQDYAWRMYRLKQAVEKGTGKMLFMGTPDAVSEGAGNDFSRGLPVYEYSSDLDTFFNYLRELGVDYVDIRDAFRRSGINPAAIMFNTDHHWTTEASFEGFKGLVTEMESLFGISLDPNGFYRDINNYGVSTYPKVFLGSFGRGTGIVFSGMDDFTLILPKFDREYSAEYILPGSRNYIRRHGGFEYTLYPPSALDITYPYIQSPYYYMYGLNSWAKIVNLDNPTGPKLLLIHDSFMQPVASFLAPMFSEIHTIWPVYNSKENPFPVNVEKYLAENSFDYVVMELYTSNLKDNGFNYFMKQAKEGNNGITKR